MSRDLNKLLNYSLSKIFLIPIFLWIISTLVFILLRVAPGDPVDAILGSGADEASREILRNKFKIGTPRIAICGLNPHAGENGHVGTEEELIIKPVVDKMKVLGFKLDGPIPADTIFAFENYKKYDVVIAMYHDQGLAPFKALAFGKAVNITLGLPIIRTSVDHGTAFDKAGTGTARSTSLEAAIKIAAQISQN